MVSWISTTIYTHVMSKWSVDPLSFLVVSPFKIYTSTIKTRRICKIIQRNVFILKSLDLCFNSRMSLSLCFSPLIAYPKHKPCNKSMISSRAKMSKQGLLRVNCVEENSHSLPVTATHVISRWEEWLSTAASLYPVYVTVGGVVACLRPSTFSWFVNAGPTSYSFALGFIMLAMGLTLELKDLLNLFLQKPLIILFGCVAQYTIMPAFGVILSKSLGLPPSVSVGLILLACCPGGTASNVVTLIAQGDVPLSVVMTLCTTLGAVVLTPLLTMILAGTYVPVDAIKLSISTLQVVVAPILLGSYLQSKFSRAVKFVAPFAPLLAVLTSSLLACSVFSENVVRLRSSMVDMSVSSDLSLFNRVQAMFTSEFGVVVVSVLLLHFAGFFVGYLSAALGGLAEPQRRAISIEVGMQNSSLGVVLANTHFASTFVALPSAMSAVIMNIMGSTLGFFWRYIDPSDSKISPEATDK